MKLQFYIEGQRIELFKDETVSLTSTIQNIQDISKVFTDFTQSFTVPASDVNNKILKHWWKAEVNGFDARTRKESNLELGFAPFKSGKAQLEKVDVRNGEPYAYTLTFYGNVVKLTDLWGDDELTDLNLDAYIHDFDSDNVKLGLEGSSLLSGDVIYPLLSPKRAWSWGDEVAASDIKWKSGESYGLEWDELKPAIRLQRIIDAIGIKYGVQFSDHFFNQPDFYDLFMWASREEGGMRAYGEPVHCIFDGTAVYYSSASETSGFMVTTTPEAGYEDVNYTVIFEINGVPTEYQRKGTSVIQTESVNGEAISLIVYVKSSQEFEWVSTMQWDIFSPPFQEIKDTSILSATGIVYFTDKIVGGQLNNGQLPKITVKDFFSGVLKMFNLVIVPETDTYFKIQTLDEWYEQGAFKDFSKYADLKEFKVTRPKLEKVIEFKYQEPDTILQNEFEGTNSVYYGDLQYENEYDGGVLDIELPFENVLLSKLSDETGAITNVLTGTILDSDLSEVNVQPFIFYHTDTITPTDDIGFINDIGNLIAVSSYNVISQENALNDVDITRSLNWGAEISSYTLTTQTASLFSSYWENYIADLYSKKKREYKFSCILPTIELAKLNLNDKIIINNRRYIINQYNANLTNGKVDFQLLNDLQDVPKAIVTNNGLEYELEFGLEG